MPMQVALVEDDARIRRVLTEILARADDCRCVAALPNGTAALAELPVLRPDVIVMDVNLPDIGGVDCVARLAPRLPGTQIIMLTVYQDPETIFQALAAGAHGYLVKPVMPEKLLEAIREIRAGGVPMSRVIARRVIDVFRRPAAPSPVAVATEDAALGVRERQILELLVAGLAYKEIAHDLGISVSTVGTYVQRIYEKLHVRSRREIIARYRVTPDSRPPGGRC